MISRPEYCRRIRTRIEAINSRIPISSLTATSAKVQLDIVKTLGLQEPKVYISSLQPSKSIQNSHQKER
jgi:ATP-dependent DNA helicase RecQ